MNPSRRAASFLKAWKWSDVLGDALVLRGEAKRTDGPVIVGGGIAGLTLAVTLAQQGVPSVVLEASPHPSEAGAGIQLGPNATRILRDLRVLDTLMPHAAAPSSITVGCAKTGKPIVELPLGAWMERRYEAPYLVLHRADLQQALLEQVAAHPEIDLRFGKRVCRVNMDGSGSGGRGSFGIRDSSWTAALEDGGFIGGPMLIGADGIWSALRRAVSAEQPARPAYSGMTASRSIIKTLELPAKMHRNVTHVWLASNAHIVMYPIRGGLDTALVVITNAPQPDRGWGTVIDRDAFMAGLATFNCDIFATLQCARTWKRWALFDPRPLTVWSKGPAILIGDAAHPMLPFLAQGGAMAIEDGYVLGRLIARYGYAPQDVFSAFEAQRRDRIQRIQNASRENGLIYHMSGLLAKARDLGMRSVPASLLMQRYDWVYNWRYDPNSGSSQYLPNAQT